MNEEYLNKVLIYLQQEIPQFKSDMSLQDLVIRFQLPNGQAFQPYYEAVHHAVTASINRVRKRDVDLDFSVKSPNQERDFKLLKING